MESYSSTSDKARKLTVPFLNVTKYVCRAYSSVSTNVYACQWSANFPTFFQPFLSNYFCVLYAYPVVNKYGRRKLFGLVELVAWIFETVLFTDIKVQSLCTSLSLNVIIIMMCAHWGGGLTLLFCVQIFSTYRCQAELDKVSIAN